MSRSGGAYIQSCAGTSSPPDLGVDQRYQAKALSEESPRSLRLIRTCKCSTGRAPKCKVFGYTFGYRHQFALIPASNAKL